jgi:hypothetical protein
LTISGWSGRFIEFGDLRSFPDEILVSKLNHTGIKVVTMERDAEIPAPDDTVTTNGWLRPRLLGHQPVLFVNSAGRGRWQNMYWKRRKTNNHTQTGEQMLASQ